jgi:hypothetical protein
MLEENYVVRIGAPALSPTPLNTEQLPRPFDVWPTTTSVRPVMGGIMDSAQIVTSVDSRYQRALTP